MYLDRGLIEESYIDALTFSKVKTGGKTDLHHVAKEWRQKSTEVKESCAEQAVEMRAYPFNGQDRQGVIAFNPKAIHTACDVESVGFEMTGLGVDPTEEVNPVVFASRGDENVEEDSAIPSYKQSKQAEKKSRSVVVREVEMAEIERYFKSLTSRF
ncbi:unnamed protein product [Mytilus coruscus]|uniref:Uncharacterized protein n=1 Tax=Mytilus coruscus TaxID=42192 RepID=A0A6J8BMK8_MYTCO|nr:unnamed protein product [Mytilus coruscus]